MRLVIPILAFAFFCLASSRAGESDSNAVSATRVTIKELLAHKKEYNGKKVELTGYYSGFFGHYCLHSA